MDEDWPLTITPDKVCYIVVKAREFFGKDEITEPDPGSNAADDGMVSVLEDQPDDPVREELHAVISALNDDEKIDLVALAWLGRGDGDVDGWNDLREEAAGARNNWTAAYLLGMPLLADYLEEALSLFDQSCLEFEQGHL